MIATGRSHWSYNAEATPKNIYTITNNEGSKACLKSVTLRCGTGRGSADGSYGSVISPSRPGNSFEMYLTCKGIRSTSNTISNVISSNGKYWPTGSCQEYTFTFTTKCEFDPNESQTLYFVKESYPILVCDYNFVRLDSGPSSNPPSIVITSYTATTDGTGPASVSWSACDGANSTVWLSINGNEVRNGWGDGSGSFSWTPRSSYGIPCPGQYTVTAYRQNELGTVSDSRTFYVFEKSQPSLGGSGLTAKINPINANATEEFSWTPSKPGYYYETVGYNPDGSAIVERKQEVFKTELFVNGTSVFSSTSNPSLYSVSNIGKYVVFNAAPMGQDIQCKVVLTNQTFGGSAEASCSITVVRIPTKQIQYNIGSMYKLISNSGSSTTIPSDAIVDKGANRTINVSFTYPPNEATRHFGIICGYRLTVIQEDNTRVEFYQSTTSLSPTVPIDIQRLKFSQQNKLKIEPCYQHNSTAYNTTSNGQIYPGPEVIIQFPSVVTRLLPPPITYPANGSTWINTKYRVLFTLPEDGDWGDYRSEIRNSYRYRDVELRITNPSTRSSVTYSWTSNSSIFSLLELGYRAKIAINPSLMSSYPSLGSYDLQVRVRKKYGYPDSSAYAMDSWSVWSSTTRVNVQTISFSRNRGDYIMATDYNYMADAVARMRNTYPAFTLLTKNVKPGDYIYASTDGHHVNPLNDINSVMSTVNNWGTYSSGRSNVKFNNGSALPGLNPERGEYITALPIDVDFPGRGYIALLVQYANMLK